jgi:hypothetical protein
MYLFITLQRYEELNGQYVDMNERNLHNDYLNMMSAPNYSNIVAPQERQHEYVNRWVWGHQTENSDHISTNTNHQLFSYKHLIWIWDLFLCWWKCGLWSSGSFVGVTNILKEHW